MPTKPSRARRWLKEGKAKIMHNDLECFTIQLTFETGEDTQPIAIGQRQMLKWLSELATVTTHQGWQRDGNGTTQLRQWLGLAEDKKNKANE